MFLFWLQTHVENKKGEIYWKGWPQIHAEEIHKTQRRKIKRTKLTKITKEIISIVREAPT